MSLSLAPITLKIVFVIAGGLSMERFAFDSAASRIHTVLNLAAWNSSNNTLVIHGKQANVICILFITYYLFNIICTSAQAC